MVGQELKRDDVDDRGDDLEDGGQLEGVPDLAAQVVLSSRGEGDQLRAAGARSLADKISAARKLGFGASLWYLGAERPNLKAMGVCPRQVLQSSHDRDPRPSAAPDGPGR